MDYFQQKDGVVKAEGVSFERLAEAMGTPSYIYSKSTLSRHASRLKEAFGDFPLLPCFAVKANSNLSVLETLVEHGYGADVVSVGELERAVLAGASPKTIVFSGVGKTRPEIERALELGILSFNVESVPELELIEQISKEKSKVAGVSLRVNPNVDAKTNPYIATGLYSTKFGIPEDEIPRFLEIVKQSDSLNLVGLSCHIGSQITELGPFREAVARMVELGGQVKREGHAIEFLDLGGGVGIRYDSENPPELEDYAKILVEAVAPLGVKLVIEPGRVLAGNIGVLLTRVLFVKKTPAKTFVIVDGAMNDLMRPSLYKSYHHIEPVRPRKGEAVTVDIVGPICESGDFLGQDRKLPPVEPGDLLIVRGCGAYAATMASNYNSRPRAPEIFVDGEEYKVIRERETLKDLWQGEVSCTPN